MGGEKGSNHTHSWRHTQAGVEVAGLDSARERGILAVTGAGRTGGPRLAVTQTDSGLARGLECVETWSGAQRGSSTNKDFFQKGN